jgi:hypothetical protein
MCLSGPDCAVLNAPYKTVMIPLLAALPFIGILIGSIFVNRVTPFVAGLPLLLAWLLLWIVLTSLIMAVIYKLDPRNRTEDGQ